LRYDRIRRSALEDGTLVLTGAKVLPLRPDPVSQARVFAAAAMVDRTHRGADMAVRVDPQRWFTNGPARVGAQCTNLLDSGARARAAVSPLPCATARQRAPDARSRP
jgi:hypothetical protein